MNINRTTSHEPEPQSRRSEHVKRVLLGGLLTATTLAGGLAFTSEVSATQPDPEHKVWVCHATAGEGELKNGYNLINVDIASTQQGGAQGENDHYGHSTTDPKVNKKFGVAPDYFLYDYILGVEEPTELPGKCGKTPPPNVEVTPSVDYKSPTCDAPGTAVRSEGEGYTWLDNEDGSWTAVADKGYFIEGDDTFGPYSTDQLAGQESCPTTAPPVVPPAPPAPPAAQIQVASNSPVAPAAAPPAAVAPAAAVSAVPTQLPSTGSSSWVTALLALVTLLGGTALVRVSRRPTTD